MRGIKSCLSVRVSPPTVPVVGGANEPPIYAGITSNLQGEQTKVSLNTILRITSLRNVLRITSLRNNLRDGEM